MTPSLRHAFGRSRGRGPAAVLAGAAALAPCCAVAQVVAPPDARTGHAGERADGGRPREALRGALREYYVHVVMDDLAVAEDRREAVTRRIEALFTAQESGLTGVRGALSELRRLVGARAAAEPTAADATSALRGLRSAEKAAATSVADARAALVGELRPAQAARLLAFEGVFRERVRALAEGGPPGGTPSPSDAQAHAPARRGGADLPLRGRLAEKGRPAARHAEVVETAKALFAHDVRSELGLGREQLLDLLPHLDGLVDVHVAMHEERRARVRALGLSAEALSSGGSAEDDAALEAAVAAALAFEHAAFDRLAEAESRVTSALGPVDAARFALVARRFMLTLPARMRALSHPAHGPDPPGGGADQRLRRGPGLPPERGRPFRGRQPLQRR